MTAHLTRGQTLVLAAATLPMIGAGVAGGWGTYSNIVTEFGRAATALGVVAAGEGVTLVLALVMVGLTMLGQAAPTPVRAGLWLAPIAAAVTGLVVADDATEAVVYAMTPMAMSASAEGLGLLARRIVVHRTGVDTETQRRNAETVQQLAYHRARAANHPKARARRRSELTSWRLAKRVGLGDAELGAQLVEVQRERLRDGADAALLDMLTVASGTDPAPAEVTAPVTTEVTVERANQPTADELRVVSDRAKNAARVEEEWRVDPLEEVTSGRAVEAVVERVEVPVDTLPEVTVTAPVALEGPRTAPPVESLVICGDRQVWPLEVPASDDGEEVSDTLVDRLPAEAAANVIRACWVLGTSVAETARQSTRSTSYVKKVFARLEESRTAEPPKREWPALVWPEVPSA
ncbi:conjugal transfer protein [Streptomyces sp. NPDC002889]|uniref:conjugal transfer protein n=1 Tax=Streptomyces sp. NPDC002889 TaxID=3364669 RepID=UPI0036A9E5E2